MSASAVLTTDAATAAPGKSAAPAPAAADGLAGMHPAYFAMVMATGIISIASFLLSMRPLALMLVWFNAAFYLVLWALLVARVICFRNRVVQDLQHHGRAVGFFTIVAATCVLGSQMIVIAGIRPAATALWIIGIVLWAVLNYTIFTILTVKSIKPTLAEGINGGWLVAVVAGQSVAVLGAQLAAGAALELRAPMLFFSLVMWLGSGMLYIWIISLIFYRYAFFTLNPSDLTPPYWINMGAVAISTLAGTMLIAGAPHSSVVQTMLPFVKGFTLLFWATATWWIPMLVILGVWRHVYQRFPLRYDPLYWGAVFPLGMYTACTFRLAQVLDAPYLYVIPRVFIWIALAAWALTLIGLIHNLAAARRSH